MRKKLRATCGSLILIYMPSHVIRRYSSFTTATITFLVYTQFAL